MIIKKLSRVFSVSAQISVEEVQDLAARGFTTIVCNRPDSEVSAGETSQDIQQAAVAAGLSFHHLPLVPGEVNSEHVEVLRNILNDDRCRILGYCRTGARAASLWDNAQTN